MTKKTIAIVTVLVSICAIGAWSVLMPHSLVNAQSAEDHYLPEWTPSGEMLLPKNNIWRTWVFVGAPLTPNALNKGAASFPEYHNVYMQPWAYAEYKKTHEFPEGTIMFKELQLILPPPQYKDGSRKEPSGRGYFPGAFNGADVSVKDSKRFAAMGNWGYFDFNHHEPKASMTAAESKDMCAFCHIAGAKKDEVWTQFHQTLQ